MTTPNVNKMVSVLADEEAKLGLHYHSPENQEKLRENLHISSSWIHHPTVMENYEKCETKLPFPHTRQERIDELKALKAQFEKDGGPVLYAEGMLVLVEYKSDEDYVKYITVMHEITQRIAKLKETK